MATKIRLQRHGRKAKPFYHVVVVDSRAPRDGKFIDRLGSYNPNTNPATVELNFEKALKWLNTGAQPTDTARSILSREGVLLKKHLEGGVKKGALTQEQAEKKFQEWLVSKNKQVASTLDGIKKAKEKERKEALDAETKVKEARAAAIVAKEATVVAEEAPATEEAVEAEVATEETTEEVAPAAPEEETPAAE